MDERKVNIDKLFRSGMEDKAETPPSAVWDKLEQRLDAAAPPRRPFPVWWFWTIAGLILISATVIIAGLPGDKAVVADNKQVAVPGMPGGQNNMPAPANADTPHTSNGELSAEENNTITNNIKPTDDLPLKENKTTERHHNPAQKPQAMNPGTMAMNNVQQVNSATQGTNKTYQPVAVPATPPFASGLPMLSSTVPQQYSTNDKPGKPSAAKVTVPYVPSPVTADVPQMDTRSVAAIATPVPSPASMQPAVVPVVSTIDATRLERPVLEPLKPSENRVPAMNVDMLLASVSPYPVVPAPVKTFESKPITESSDNIVPLQPVSDIVPDGDTTKKKKSTDTTDVQLVIGEDQKVKKDRKPMPIEAGIKGGYSMGFNSSFRANKFAIAPYIELGLSSRLSLTFQPTYHTGGATIGKFDNGEQSYYEIKNSSFDSTERVVRGVVDSTVVTANPPDTVYRTYNYKQEYDSVYVSYGVSQKQLWDIEMPLILKYKIDDRFAVLAGGSVTYSSVLQVQEDVQRYNMVNEYSEVLDPQTFYVTQQGQQPPSAPPPKALSDLFSYTGEPYDNFTPRSITNSKNFFRYGFMVGASATFRERLMIELMLHKTGVDVNSVPDKQLQKLYSQPYLRIMVGYKIFK